MLRRITVPVLIWLLVRAIPTYADSLCDTLSFGNHTSEAAHQTSGILSETLTGAFGQPARRLLPRTPTSWDGGSVSFTMKVDPEKQNYLTAKLWGADKRPDQLVLFVEGKMVGYHNIGDIDLLDISHDEPSDPSRFLYTTTPLPLEITHGKTRLHCEIRANGQIWAYGMTFDRFQLPMTEPTRGIYRIYTHTDGCFTPPNDETQPKAPNSTAIRKTPGPEVLEQLKSRLSDQITKMLNSKTPLRQDDLQILAHAYHVTWTPAYHNPKVVSQILLGADKIYRDFRADSKVGEDDWSGLGLLGDAIRQVADGLTPHLDEKIDDGKGEQIVRRAAYSQLLQHSRDWHREHRRYFTNQSMITDLYGIYLCNRGVEAVDAANALTEDDARHYLYEAMGMRPWLGSDTDKGPEKAMGDHYSIITQQGLSREFGYVGHYGEVLDWATHIYHATETPGQPNSGDPKIKAQLIKLETARSVFRYPTFDKDDNRAMRMETIVGWRDSHYPGDIAYGEASAGEGSAFYSAAVTLTPEAIGAAQQMIDDNQFFASVAALLQIKNNPSVTRTLLHVPDQYAILTAQPKTARRLPMTPGQPDFVFTDPEDGVIALKHGSEIVYISLYWRARYAINHLARVHDLTPQYDKIAVVREDEEFEPSGFTYTRPDWTAVPFGSGGVPYPVVTHQAFAGEVMPIAKIPAGVSYTQGTENPYAGRADFYKLRYGNYLIGMNASRDKTFDLPTPAGNPMASELVSGKVLRLSGSVKVGPMSTVILYFTPK